MGCNESKAAQPAPAASTETAPAADTAAPAAAAPAMAEPQAEQSNPPLTDFEWDDEEEETDEVADLPSSGPPPSFAKNRKQRQSVSAECFGDQMASYVKKATIPKTDAARTFLRTALKGIVLFMGIDDDQTNEVIDACEEKSAASGEVVIKQGDKTADYFYIVESGTAEASLETVGVVKQYTEPGASFGELALMYSAPRAATITATSDMRLWALDRTTFQVIVIASTRIKREKYEAFLRSVPLLSVLNGQEIAALSDVLEPTIFEDGATIVNEGEDGDTFYIVEEGEVNAKTSGGDETVFKKGEYFGELALLTKEPRKATCVATGRCKLVKIDVTAFGRLLGKAEELLLRNAEKYKVFLEKGAGAVFQED